MPVSAVRFPWIASLAPRRGSHRTPTRPDRVRSALVLVLRLLLALPGGYALTVGVTALATLGLARLMQRGEAYVLAAMLAFLFYLAIVLWVFAEQRLTRIALVVVVGAIGTLALTRAIGG